MYRNVVYNPKKRNIFLSHWDANGNRVSEEIPFRPYLYMKDQTGTDGISIYGEPLKRYDFDTSWDRKVFCESTKKTYFCLPPEQQFLIDRYWMYPQNEEFSKFPLKIWLFDIEVFSPDGFPNATEAKWPINVITIFDYTEKVYHVFTTARSYVPRQANTRVYLYPDDETAMIKAFVRFWRKDFPDIISGFYSFGFDCPYLCNRLKIIYQDDEAPCKLSPVGRTYCKESAKIRLGSEEKTYEQLWTICGVTHIDLQAAYLKFSRVKLASYSLNYVCDHEKVGQKLEHEGSLSDWWLTDPQEFIDYNVQDVALLVKLEDKLRFLELCRAVAYSGLCPLELSLRTLDSIGGMVAIEALHKNRIISSFDNTDAVVNYEGGYVSEPVPGFHTNILSIDANSMYPSALRSFNMSNETKVGFVSAVGDGKYQVSSISGKSKVMTREELDRMMKTAQVACTPNGILFSQKTDGIIPSMVTRMYATRKSTKAEMLKLEKDVLSEKDPARVAEMRKKAEFLNLRQYLMKIQLNSVYGALCSKYFVLFDIDIGASITNVGRTMIKTAQRFLDDYASKFCSYSVETQTYGDTDSRYFTINQLLIKAGQQFILSTGEINPWVLDLAKKIEDYVNERTTKTLKEKYGCKNPVLTFKTETIAPAGIWSAKKRYVVHCRMDEGIPCDELHYTGIDIKRSTCPKRIRPFLANVVETMLRTQDRQKTMEVLNRTYDEYRKLPFEDKVVSMGCSNVSEYTARGQSSPNSIMLGTPRQIVCAIRWNNMIKADGLMGQFSPIHDNEKISLYYCKDNGDGITSFGYKDKIPDIYRERYVFDEETMYKKTVLSCLDKLFEAVGWEIPDPTKGEEDLMSLIG